MIKMVLARNPSTKIQTIGRLFLMDKKLNLLFSCATLEPAWKNNKTNLSCIEAGLYEVEHRHSEKYEHHLMIKDVNGRDLILLHWGNFFFDTTGCIIVGNKHRDINKDGHLDVLYSKVTFKRLMKIIGDEKKITLRICYT